MLKISIIDLTASSRSKLYQIINKYLQFSGLNQKHLPAFSLDSLSPNEIKYCERPDVIVVGEDLINSQPAILKSLQLEWPETGIVSYLSNEDKLISQIESLARFGVSDVIGEGTTAKDFIKKVILLSRKQQAARSGKIIVIDSAKGGQGATSVAVGLADQLARNDLKVLMVDLDFQSQSLSRFTQSRPFYNETLKDILLGQRAITKEVLNEAVASSWLQSEVDCLVPISVSDLDQVLEYGKINNLLDVIQKYAECYQVIVIDLANAGFRLSEHIYRIVDQAYFVISNDPAAIYASCEKLKVVWNYLTHQQELVLIENRLYQQGLASNYLREQVLEYLNLENEHWCREKIKFCPKGFLWPASGESLLSLSTKHNQKLFLELANKISELSLNDQKNIFNNVSQKLLEYFSRYLTWNRPSEQISKQASVLPQIQLDPVDLADQYDTKDFILSKSVANSGC